MIGQALRAPAVHFLVIGALLATVESRWGASNTPFLDATVADDELLYREAVALGVDRRDDAVRGRLARLGSFVGEDAADEATLEAEARRLGLERSDVVVKRHLAQMMRLAAGRLERGDFPTEAELHAYLETHADEFAMPARVRFTHVYLSRSRRGGRVDDDAQRLLDELRRGGVSPEDAGDRGDAFLGGASVGPASAADLERRFGHGFAEGIQEATPGTWVGPIPSSYGLHLVWVHERLPVQLPSFDSVQGRIVHRLLRERGEARAEQRIAALRARLVPPRSETAHP
jgi:peptidyl-prolyl cis-trans isomerase C